jgi:hypothetical protein
MTFKPAIWRPIAAVLSVLNLAAVGFAAQSAEPWHATTHAALALAFGYWALRLKKSPSASDRDDRLEELESEIGSMRRELTEAQERLDFAERVMAQAAEARRVGPEP